MPELPEVETTRRGIEPFLSGQKILSADIRQPVLRWPVSDEIALLKEAPVTMIERRGKYLIIGFAEGTMLIHLGMSGSLRVVDGIEPLKKHDHVIFHLSGGKSIRFNDPRRFGCVIWTHDWQAHPLISTLGPEPLSDEFNADYLHSLAKKRTLAVKQFIMNSKVVVGVGNIYANEALYLAGIHPKRAVNKLSRKRLAVLTDQIKQVLQKAITQGGTTLRDFVGGDGKPGYFQQQLYVYGRGGEPCKQCGTLLKEVRMNNRSTVLCQRCQT